MQLMLEWRHGGSALVLYTINTMKKVALWTVLGSLFIIPFLPLFVANAQFFPFITGKGFWFRILVEIAVVAWGALMLADAKYRPKFSWVLVLYAALVVWMFVANLLAINPHKAFWSNFERMDGWVTLIHVFGFFLVTSSVLTAQNLWRKWWLTFVGASALVALVALLQLSGVLAINQGGVRVDATFGNAAYLAAYLLFAIAISAWQAVESKEKWLRYALLSLAAVHVIILFYTATRGAILGAIGGAILGAALYTFLGAGKKAKQIGVSVLAGLVVLVGGFVLIKDADFIQNDPTLNRLASISLEEGSTRFAIWGIAYQGFQERPVFGWGQEGFNHVFNKYYEPSLYAQEVWFDRAHDVYLDWLVAGGLPAFLFFIGLLAVTSWTLLRSRELSKTEKVFLLSALGAYAFQAVFVFDNLFTYVPLAAILAMAHAASAKPIKKVETLPTVKAQEMDTMVAPIAAVLAIALVWSVNIPNMQAAHNLILAVSPKPQGGNNIAEFQKALDNNSFARQEIREHLVQYSITTASRSNLSQSQQAELASFTVAQMGDEVERNPNDVRLRYYLALAYRIAGNPQAALEQMDAAIALSPSKQFLYLEKGTTALEAGNRALAYEMFKTAYELDTRNAQAAGYMAAGLLYAGSPAQAEALLMEKFGTTTVDNPALFRAYYDTQNFDPFIAIWKQRVTAANGDPNTRFGLVSAYVVSGRVPEAIAEIRSIIADHPGTAQQGAAMLRQLGASI